MNKLEVIGR